MPVWQIILRRVGKKSAFAAGMIVRRTNYGNCLQTRLEMKVTEISLYFIQLLRFFEYIADFYSNTPLPAVCRKQRVCLYSNPGPGRV